MMKYFTLSDFSFKGKTVILRIDAQTDLIKGKPIISERMIAHSKKTIKPLLQKGAKLVILVHQGKKPGTNKYCELQQHAQMLSTIVGKKITYVHDIYGKKAVAAIHSLKDGQAILLRNVRCGIFVKEEKAKKIAAQHAKSKLVMTLQPLADYFVSDAFSAAHRSHASVIGFTGIPNIAGSVMQEEIDHNIQAAHHSKKPYVAVLGGAKVHDYIHFITRTLASGRVSMVLGTGLVGELMLLGKGYDLGQTTGFLEKKELLDLIPTFKKLIKKYPKKLIAPIDLAFNFNGKRSELGIKHLPSKYVAFDIGTKTAEMYAQKIMKAKTIYMKGPPGMFENPHFAKGSKIIVKAITSATKKGAFSLCGGGESIEVIRKFASLKAMSYVSLSGGALISFLAGDKLPGLVALEKSYIKFNRKL